MVLGEIWRAARGRRRASGLSFPAALGAVLAQNRRRHGGLVVHLGVVLVAIGVATSTVGKVEREATVRPGETLEIGRYQLRCVGLSAVERATHLLVTADVAVSDRGRPAGVLQPGQRFYPGSTSPFATVDLRYRLGHDLYLILGAFDRQGQWATLKAQLHPLVGWIWNRGRRGPGRRPPGPVARRPAAPGHRARRSARGGHHLRGLGPRGLILGWARPRRPAARPGRARGALR